MSKARELIGLPVLAGVALRRIGRVKEVLVSRDGDRLCGLVLEAGGLVRPRKVLDYQAVTAIGPTHILAEEQYLAEEGQTKCCRELLGLPVLTHTGEELGMMDDLYFDPMGGHIIALQLSRGFVDDLLRGKAVTPVDGTLRPGEAAILLDGPGEQAGGVVS